MNEQFLKLYMDERNRYLATSRRVVWRKARESWGLDAEVNEIDARASAIHMQLQEAVSERSAQDLAAAVHSRRVLRSKDHKVRMRAHGFLRFRNKQLAVVVKQPIERFENL